MEMRDLQAEVVGIAERQASLTDDELLEFLEYEWERAGLALADRGPGDYLKGVRDELLARAVREQETVGVVTAMIANDVLNWVGEHGLVADQYAFVIGLLVAWLTRAVLSRSSGAAGDQDKPGDHDSGPLPVQRRGGGSGTAADAGASGTRAGGRGNP